MTLIWTSISYDWLIDESGELYSIPGRYSPIVSRVICGCIFMTSLKRLASVALIFMVSSLNSLKTDDVSRG